MKYNINFSEKKHKKYYGTYTHRDRNFPNEIIVYADAQDKIKTLIHELIHHSLFEQSKGSNILAQKLNKNERIIDNLALDIKRGLIEVGVIKEEIKS